MQSASAPLRSQVAGVGATTSTPDSDGECYDATSGHVAELKLGRMAGASQRVNFIENRGPEKPNCPSTDATCRKRAFVTAGDMLLVAPAKKGFVCASFKSPKGVATDGFLPATAIEPVVSAAPASADFAGTWRRDDEATIVIKATGSKLSVKGDATYGAGDPDRVRRGAVNVGQLEGETAPHGDVLALGQGYDGAKAPADAGTDDCFARLRLLGRYLVVEDNNTCGGMNVSFNGVYVHPGR